MKWHTPHGLVELDTNEVAILADAVARIDASLGDTDPTPEIKIDWL